MPRHLLGGPIPRISQTLQRWPRTVTIQHIVPGLPKASFLYQKLQAATKPDSVQVAGSPMPIGAMPLSDGELEAVRIWISAGAPEKGSVGDSSRLR